jgi:prepilin-type N-terminal cleavage/methylation domain-containing protein
MRRSERAFTLLEVMAAVAVVAIVFTTLARVANQGLQSQGTSKRRFEASLIADRALADIESDLQIGIVPEFGEVESEEGFFDVLVEVTPFDMASLPSASPGEGGSTGAAALPAPTAANAEASPIRTIEITVTWQEGFEEQRVIRTTFGLDREAIPLPEGGGGNAPQLRGAGGLSR